MAIVCGSDDRNDSYARAASVALSSALRHLPADIDVKVVYLSDGLSTMSRQRIRRVVENAHSGAALRFADVDSKLLAGFPISGHLSRSAYLRLVFDRFIPEGVERALYLDCDVIVVQSLAELLRRDMKNRTVAATRDYIVPEMDWRNREGDKCSANAAKYFNSGLFMVDVARWRSRQIEKHALEFARQHSEQIGVGCDQDVLNATLAGDWLELPPEWNLCSQLLYLEDFEPHAFRLELLNRRSEILKGARIIHFAGPSKPWNHWSTHPYTNRWVAELLQCRWFTWTEAFRWKMRWSIRRTIVRVKVACGRLKVIERTASLKQISNVK